MRKVVKTENAPGAIGPYSQGVVFQGSLVYTAGQVPLDPVTGVLRNGTIEEATKQVLENVKAILTEAGSSLENVVKTTVFMSDLTEFSRMNAVYSQYFEKDPPARSAVQVSALPLNARIEIEAVALIK
ncbi:MAG: RidA family protein [Deferribacteres bacterium]|nr:RidA family protein [candidate division KSB1 bacterium]MCB9503324.1 RidA family protein [Deferribacteres bacterium]